ncbi:MFS transporter [Vibrio sp. SS-MA-C1-2]|uniref:MFS transporter n=1 Tax=Vibrio sp. SS-MA-C1-2 TaxID=2908646 RepID=UPI001F1DB8BD|nr:MFS transporter [Vibrio sp. SS-MA-C1-2]UJF18406.1 MFS transporter [Vibrio sp. SS-MA-C1-2]
MLKLPRNIWLLALMQPLVVSTGGLNSVVASIIGNDLSQNPNLATLPIAAFMTGLALFVVPGSKLQERFGRKPLFIVASLLSAIIGLMAAISIEQAFFWGFVSSCFAFGTQMAVIVQYRYAAIESCQDQQDITKALSLILMGEFHLQSLGLSWSILLNI